jgi:type IV pilus assembly protein PilW
MTQSTVRPAYRHRKIGGSQMRGFSLVEIMISLVIGLVVVGAVMVTYLSNTKSSQQQAAYAEMNENAQLGLGIISRDLMLAGYSTATGTTVSGGVTTFTRAYSQRAVFGCVFGFTSPNQSAAIAAADCVASAGKPGIEVVYQADVVNTVPTSGNVPSDCLGNGLTIVGANYFAYNRYYLSSGNTGRSELHCASPGNAGQPLVDNVDGMKVWYGEAAAADPRSVVRYVTAANVTDWMRVVSVRVCLLMRSNETVLQSSTEDTMTYLDCDSTSQTSTDRYARRAYFTTATLRNKMAL